MVLWASVGLTRGSKAAGVQPCATFSFPSSARDKDEYVVGPKSFVMFRDVQAVKMML